MDELDEEWKIMDYRYTSHTVKCNKDLIFPLLKEAWTEMKDVFGFTDQQDITLFYYGNNLFGIISSKPLQEYVHLPIYHSHAYLPGHTSHFCVRLTTDINDKPFMVIFFPFLTTSYISSSYSVSLFNSLLDFIFCRTSFVNLKISSGIQILIT
jgi:hypothetical protein